MNRIVNQTKRASRRDGKGIQWRRLILVAAILGLLTADVPSPLPIVGPVFGTGGIEAFSLTPGAPDPPRAAAALKTYGELPLSFEVNQGQMDTEVKLLSRGRGYTLFLTSTEAVLVLRKPSAVSHQRSAKAETTGEDNSKLETTVRMKLFGANPGPQIALERLVGKVNYFIGNDPSKWRNNIPTYAKVHYRDVYPGVELVYYGQQGQLEYDFIVSPGTDPSAIRLAFEGVDKIEIDDQGDLVLSTGVGEIRLRKPLIYQDTDGARREISGGYVLNPKSKIDPSTGSGSTLSKVERVENLKSYEVGFQVAAYDVSKPLVIDPVLNYSTYLGGSGNDAGLGIAVDSAGNAYITGSTDSTNFPTSLALQIDQGGTDAFVTKLSSSGSALLYSTYLGGSGNDAGLGIAVDSAGNAYVTGSTDSTNFPTSLALQIDQGGTDAFVTKISPDGSALLYSTYLGGSGNDAGLGIAVDSAGNAYITGSTDSTNFPTSLAVQFDQGGTDAFVTKLNSNGSALLYSTYLGGSGNDVGSGIAVDSAGNAYVAGSTNSSDFPLVNGVQGPQGGTDAFVTKLNSNGSAILYSTYLGGSGNDVGLAIAVSPAGRAYITGFTDSNNFPMKKAFQGYQGATDAFVTRLNPAASGLSSLLYSTYLGGSGNDEGHSIAVDSEGNTYITGATDSSNFPTQNTIQGYQGSTDAFVTKVDPSVSGSGSVLYSTFLGGSGIDEGNGIALDAAGNGYVTGMTDSPNFPVISGFATTLGGFQDAFVAKVAQPDLLVSAFSVPSTGGAGSTISVADTTKNQGAATAEASTTKFYLSTDTILDAGDTLLGSRAIPSLAGGESSVGSTELAVPPETGAGSYYILAKVDADNSVAEAFEDNNKSSRTIQIVHGPDLIVSALSTASSGSTITVTDTTKNQGVVSASDSTTKFYLSTDSSFDAGDVLLGGRAIPTLAAGATSTASTTLTIPAGTAGGSYYIIAKADADNLVSEVNEENNTKASGAFIVGPDLIVSTLFAPSTTGAGSTIIVSNTTKSQGVTSSGASITKFYLSTDTNLDSADTLLGSRAVATLAAGGTSVESTSLTIPAATATGSYYIIAQADADGAVTENNEGNNTLASNAFTIGADLIVSGLTAPSSGTPGSAISVTETTKNQGGGSTGASTTKFYLSANATFDAGDILLGSRAVPALAEGATSTASTTLTLPAGIGGTYYIVAQADGDNAVAETNEANNTASSTAITVSPDLTISAFSVPTASGAGLTVSVTDTTKNQGVVSASASTTKFFFSTDASLDGGDILLGSRAIPALAPAATSAGTTTLVIPAGTAAGSYFIIAKADADAVVLEIDENNNTLTRAIAIGPDLIISLLSGPEKADTGLIISMTETTKNDGGGAAAGSTTKFFLSSDTILDPGDIFLGSRAVPALAPGGTSAETTALTIPMGTASGIYYVIALADADNGVAETNEANNPRASHAIKIGPELNVDALTAQPSAGAGSAIAVNDTVINRGGGTAGTSTTKFYLSTDATLDASDIFLGSRAVPTLSPAATSPGSTSVTIPAGIAGGTYYIIAQADADNTVDELDEANNIRTKAILIGSDLIVWMDLPASSSTAAPGSTISVTDTTKNDSSAAAAGPSTTKFYLSTDTTLDAGDLLIGSRAIPTLAPGATSTASNTLTIPVGTGGSYYIIAQADGDNSVAELNEGNNTAASSRTILIGPDLIVWIDLPASASSAAPGSTLNVTDFTKNDSFGPAGASTTKFYLSADTTLDAGDTFLGSRAVPALAAGVTNSGSTPVTLPAGLAGGTYYIIAQTDADNAVAEFNEGNNVAVSSGITIGADLTVWLDVPAASSTPAAGSTISMNDTTRNDSFAGAGASTTKFYLSSDSSLDAGDILLGSRAVPALAAGATSSASTPLTLPAGIAGTYYVIAQADGDNAIAEVNEGNNTQAKTITIGADLIVWIDPPGSVLTAGSTVVVPDWTRNDNSAPAGASTTKFFLSTDTILDASDVLLGSRAIPALPPSTTNQGSTTLTLPVATAPGSYYIIAQADGDHTVLEFNEGNNTIAKPITIAAPQNGSDLIVWLDLPAASSTAAPGSTISVTDTTKNDSLVYAPSSTTKFYLSTDTTLGVGDIFVGSRAIPTLAPGATSTASNALTIPVGIGGSYYILAQADADNAITELSETNNITASSRTILIGSDLIVWLDLPASSTTVPAASTIYINDVTTNNSSVSAGASTTKFYLSSDTALDASDIPLSSRAIPALAAGVSSSGSTPLTLPAGIAGTYYIIAQADGDSLVPEFNEGNNTTPSNPVAVGPDLIITGVTTGAMVPAQDGSGLILYINDTTKNKGADSAGASTTRFFLSADATLDAGDLVLGSRAIPALAPSEYNSGTTTVLIPAATPAGTYYIIALADGGGVVSEASETNNTFARLIEILPDLTVPTIAAPSKAYPNATITVSDTTKNQGASSSASTTRFFLSTNTILDVGDLLLGNRAVPALGSGATSQGSTSVTLPNLAGGTYYIIALADADSTVAELSETNNTRYKTLTVGPDLVVSTLSVPSTAVAGAAISVADTTKNRGSASADSTTKFYLSTDTIIGAGDVLLGSRSIPALTQEQSSSVSTTLTLPSGIAGGAYYIIAQADGDNAVAELIETNNTRASAITITP